MTITEEILNKLAYADGGKTVNDNGLTVYDNGKRYSFNLGEAAYALNLHPNENPVTGVASRVIGFGVRKPERPKRKLPYIV